MEQNENNIIIYQDGNGISQHMDSIYREREPGSKATHKDFLLVRTEGKRQVRRNIGKESFQYFRIKHNNN